MLAMKHVLYLSIKSLLFRTWLLCQLSWQAVSRQYQVGMTAEAVTGRGLWGLRLSNIIPLL